MDLRETIRWKMVGEVSYVWMLGNAYEQLYIAVCRLREDLAPSCCSLRCLGLRTRIER